MQKLHRSDTTASVSTESALPPLERRGRRWPRITVSAAATTQPKSFAELMQRRSHQLLDPFPGFRDGVVVQLRNANDIVYQRTLLSASDIDETHAHLKATLPELSRLNAELADIATLDEGWYEPGSPAISPLPLRFGRNVAFALSADDLPLPHAFPTPEGGVSLEWTLGPVEASLTINRDAATVTFSAWDSVTDEHDFRQEAQATPSSVRDWVDKLATNQ